VESMFSEAFERFLEFVSTSVSGGYIVALTAVCLAQYFLHFVRVYRLRSQAQSDQDLVKRLTDELLVVRKDGTAADMSNHILRDFIAEPKVERALEFLLRRFVPDQNSGFAALLQIHSNTAVVVTSRGLSDQSRQNLQIDSELLERVRRDGSVVVEESSLMENQYLPNLSSEDLLKAERVYLIAISEEEELDGVLITTQLCASDAQVEEQIELAKQVMSSVAVTLKRTKVFETRQYQLQSTQQMLDLSTICDLPFETPMKMVETFLTRLMGIIGADRVVLSLNKPDRTDEIEVLIRSGIPLDADIESLWIKCENSLSSELIGQSEARTFDVIDLEKIGIQEGIGSAVVAPLVQKQEVIGVITFSRGDSEPFLDYQRSLVTWAAEHLAHTLQSALNGELRQEFRESSVESQLVPQGILTGS